MKTKGFTLIELIVIVGILSLLSAYLVTYSKTGEKQIVFFKEQNILTSAIFRAKNLAVSTYGRGSANSCGYGIHFNLGTPQEIIIFSDLTSGSDCSRANKAYSLNENIEKIVLDSRVRITNSPRDFIFIPPDPTVYPSGGVVINLELNDRSKSAVVSVSGSGQITVK